VDRTALEAHLATLGLRSDPGLGLDATITPETLARDTARRANTPRAASVGPLPHIALSGLGTGASANTHAATGGTADLEILTVLGEGGMGRVHLARQRSLGREVAIKTLKPEIADTRAVEMLHAEATTMGRLEHPNVVPVHAVGRDDTGQLLLVMKRIDGVAWRDLLRDPSHPRWSSLAERVEDRLEVHLDVLAQIANALHFAHGRGVVHRDVKPDNVLVGEQGEIYLADWGIAMRSGTTGPAELVGTPAYMAPEMVMGDPAHIDARTDVFLLGASLHEVLSGGPPHDGSTLHAVLAQALSSTGPTYGPEVPAELAVIAARAMAPRPEDRFPTALAFRHALDERRRHRGAVSLLASARALLSELTPAITRGQGEAEIDRRITECRFALVQALREWPESTEARVLLRTVLRLAIRHELDRESTGAARALLSELREPHPDLEREVGLLEARLASARSETERLRGLERDEDLHVGLGGRIATVSILVAFALGISAYMQTRTVSAATITHEMLLTIGSLLVAVTLGGMAIFRRQLLRNTAGRRVAGLLAASVVSLLVHRGVGVALDVAPAAILALDLVVLALICAACGVVVPRAAWSAAVPLTTLPLIVAYPAETPRLFGGASVLTLVALGGLWLWGLRAQRLARARQDARLPAP